MHVYIAGDEVVVILNETKKGDFNFYDYCKYKNSSKKFQKDKIKITIGSVSATYKIFRDTSSGAKNFSITGCGTSKRIMFEKELSKASYLKRNNEGCNEIYGEYSHLYNLIETAINN